MAKANLDFICLYNVVHLEEKKKIRWRGSTSSTDVRAPADIPRQLCPPFRLENGVAPTD